MIRVYIKHQHLNRLANLQHLGRVRDLFCPSHLGNMDQPLHALLQLHKGAVIHQAQHLTSNASPHRIVLLNSGPGVRRDLLHSKGDPLALRIKLENRDLDMISHLHHL